MVDIRDNASRSQHDSRDERPESSHQQRIKHLALRPFSVVGCIARTQLPV